MIDAVIRMESQGIVVLGTAGIVVALITMLAAWLAWREWQRCHPLPEAERAAAAALKAEQAEERALFRAIIKEARFLAKEMPVHMAIQNEFSWNFHEVRRDGRRKRKKSLVQFDAILLTRTEIWFKVNGRKLPYGTSFSDIRKPENQVATNLQYAIHRPVQFYEDQEFNFFIRVGLKNSIMGIPKRVEWSKAVENLPAGNPFAVVMGVNENNKIIYHDLRKWPHGIIAGATEMGKSVQMTNWLITLISRNPPHMCRFVLVDLKDGVELSRFRAVPHVDEFIEEKAQVTPALHKLIAEYHRRMELFKGTCSNIAGWNAQTPQKLPYIFVVVDELADLMLDRALKTEASEAFSELARKGRAAGIHLILATQILEAAVLNLQIRGNISGRLCFSVPTATESMLVINTGAAAALGGIRGRCVYKSGASNTILQAPIASQEDIEQVIAAAIGEQPDKKGAGLDEIGLFRLVHYNYGGAARAREIWQDGAREHISLNRIGAILKAYEYDPEDPEGSVIEFDGHRFLLAPSRKTHAGTRPRMLVPINGKYPATVQELHHWAETGSQITDHETTEPEEEATPT